jgi:hypothetical protein
METCSSGLPLPSQSRVSHLAQDISGNAVFDDMASGCYRAVVDSSNLVPLSRGTAVHILSVALLTCCTAAMAVSLQRSTTAWLRQDIWKQIEGTWVSKGTVELARPWYLRNGVPSYSRQRCAIQSRCV